MIKAAYRILSAKHHPDRNGGDSRSVEIMSILNNSYAVLSDKDARRQHDVWIKQQEAARSRRPSAQAFAQARQPDYSETPAWAPDGLASNAKRWGDVESRSAATEAALAQERLGKVTALIAAVAAVCMLVFALLSEQGSGSQQAARELASAPAPSVGTAAAREDASDPIVWVSTRRDEAPERAIHVATAFAKSESLLDARAYTARIHDDGDAWLVSYRSPAERRAAAPIVLIDKESMRVIGYYAGDR